MPDSRPPQLCDYEGSNYRTEFWEGQGRNYEDKVERVALRRLLPESGRRLLEIGAGFGRLTGEYRGYEQVVLLDYSFSQLQHARDRYGDTGFVYVAGDVYRLPFRSGVFDAATMIRVIHHMADAGAALRQVRRVLMPQGVFVLEFANKRNLKAMLRYALKKQTWNPYTPEPVEFVELNFDFHPRMIYQTLADAQFSLQARVPVSFFRLGLLKNTLPTGLLVGLDALLQYTGLHITPSIFTRSLAAGETPNHLTARSLFVCPQSGGELTRDGDTLVCEETGVRYAIRDGIYDFKAPLDG